MTNLSTTSRQPWLTRGRLLVGLPLGFGVLVSFGFMAVGVRPLLQTAGFGREAGHLAQSSAQCSCFGTPAQPGGDEAADG